MAFEARVKSARLVAAKEGRENNQGETVGDKPSMLVVQLEVEDPSEEVLGLLVRLSRRPDDIKVELSSYQTAMEFAVPR